MRRGAVVLLAALVLLPGVQAAVNSLTVSAPAGVLVGAVFTVSGQVRSAAVGTAVVVGSPSSTVEVAYEGLPTVVQKAGPDGRFSASFVFPTPGARRLTVVSDRDTVLAAGHTGSTVAAYAPDPPRDLVLDENLYRRVAFHWTAPAYDGGASVASYDVYRASGGGAASRLGGTTGTSWVDTTVAASTAYTYHVVAVTVAARSAPSAPLSLTSAPPPTVPDPPTALAAEEVTYRSVRLRWQPPASDGGSRIQSYEVQRSTGGAWTSVGGTTGLTWTDTLVAADTPYQYRLTAKNAVGRSAPSDAVAVRTLPEPASDALTATFVDFLACSGDEQQDCARYGDGATVDARGSDWAVRIQAYFVGETSAGGEPLPGVTVTGRVDANLVPVYDVAGYAFSAKTNAAGAYTPVQQPMQWAPPEDRCTTATWTMTAARSGLTASDSATLTVCR